MKSSRAGLRFLTVTLGLLALSSALAAKNKKVRAPPSPPQDRIEVLGHLALTDGPVRRLLTTQHYSRFYLYVEHDAGRSITLIDVTKATQPAVLADVAFSPDGGAASLSAVAGTAALVTDQQGPSAPPAPPQTIRIMDFSDPQHPKVAREFAGVTAMSRDERRGLIFLANPEGIWILHQSLAEDPEVEAEYARHILYDH